MPEYLFKDKKAAEKFAEKHPTSKRMQKTITGQKGSGVMRSGRSKKPWRVMLGRRGLKT